MEENNTDSSINQPTDKIISSITFSYQHGDGLAYRLSTEDVINTDTGDIEEFSNYDRIIGYKYKKTPTKIDLTFASPQDVIDLCLINSVEDVKINLSNLKTASFVGNRGVNYDIVRDCNLREVIPNLEQFLTNNLLTIKSINIRNLHNKILQNKILNTCLENDIYEVTFLDEKDNKKSNVYCKKKNIYSNL